MNLLGSSFLFLSLRCFFSNFLDFLLNWCRLFFYRLIISWSNLFINLLFNSCLNFLLSFLGWFLNNGCFFLGSILLFINMGFFLLLGSLLSSLNLLSNFLSWLLSSNLFLHLSSLLDNLLLLGSVNWSDLLGGLLLSLLSSLDWGSNGVHSSGLHGALETGSSLFHFLILAHDDFLLLGNFSRVLLLQVHADLVVDEGKHHAVVEGDQVGGLVLGHLLVALHEHKSAIGRKLVLALLGDGPASVVVVRDLAVVSRHSLELDLDLTLHGAANGELLLVVCFQKDFFLN